MRLFFFHPVHFPVYCICYQLFSAHGLESLKQEVRVELWNLVMNKWGMKLFQKWLDFYVHSISNQNKYCTIYSYNSYDSAFYFYTLKASYPWLAWPYRCLIFSYIYLAIRDYLVWWFDFKMAKGCNFDYERDRREKNLLRNDYAC